MNELERAILALIIPFRAVLYDSNLSEANLSHLDLQSIDESA